MILFEGKKWNNYKEICEYKNFDNKTTRLVYSRLRAGWCMEDAIYKKKRKELIDEEKEKERKLQEELSKNAGISVAGYYRRLKCGMDEKEAKLKKKYGYYDSKIYDHKGNEFKTVKEMRQFYGISDTTFKRRRKAGWSLKEILENNPKDRDVCFDYLGNKFRNQKEMASFYSLSLNLLRRRLYKYGVTKKAFEPKQKTGEATKIKSVDFLGNEYDSIREMCEAWSIDPGKFMDRIRLGWSVEDALTIKKNEKSGGEKVVEYILREKNIPFEYNKRIDSIVMANSRQRVDFWIPSIRGVIEFDGEQHFKGFGTTTSTKELLQERDKRKDLLLLKNNIPVMRIKYTQINEVEELICDFLSFPTKYLKRRNKKIPNKNYWE